MVDQLGLVVEQVKPFGLAGSAGSTPLRIKVTEFFDGAIELGEAEVSDEVSDEVIDEGLGIVRKLWDAGFAHRDVKPANLLVRDGKVLLIDVAFVQARQPAR